MATQTRKKNITNTATEIADSSAGDAAVTIYNPTEHLLSFFVDHRTPEARETAGDNIAIKIPPYGKESFAGFDGKVYAYFATVGNSGEIPVVVS